MRLRGVGTIVLATLVAACGRADKEDGGVVGTWRPDPALVDASAKAYGEEEFRQNRAFSEQGAHTPFLRDLAALSGIATMGKSALEIADLMRGILLKQRITLNADGSATTVPSRGAYTARWTRTGDRLEVVAELGTVTRVVFVFAIADNELNLKSVKDTLEAKAPSPGARQYEAIQVKRWIRADK